MSSANKSGPISGFENLDYSDSDHFSAINFTEYPRERNWCSRMRRDPAFQPEHIHVSTDELGGISAQLWIVDRLVRVEASTLRMAGVAGVCTEEGKRGRGLAGDLMREAMAFMKQQGFDISILFSIPEEYYTRFGYTSVLPEYSAAVTGLRCLNRLSRLKTHLNTRALRKSDIPLLAPLYETSFREVTGSCIRSSEHWHWLSSHPEFSGVGVMSDNGLAAYALTKATRNDLVVHEVGPTLLLR